MKQTPIKNQISTKEDNFINQHLLAGAKSVRKENGTLTAFYNNYRVSL